MHHLDEAPSIINTLISMAMPQNKLDQFLYEGQEPLQDFLMTICFLAVPIMLIPKPLFLWLGTC